MDDKVRHLFFHAESPPSPFSPPPVHHNIPPLPTGRRLEPANALGDLAGGFPPAPRACRSLPRLLPPRLCGHVTSPGLLFGEATDDMRPPADCPSIQARAFPSNPRREGENLWGSGTTYAICRGIRSNGKRSRLIMHRVVFWMSVV